MEREGISPRRSGPLGIKQSPVWSFFSSLRLTLVLLAVLAVLAVAGTLVPQQETAQELARRFSPATIRILGTLQVFDLYHSAWFLLTMGLLAANLVVCSLNRFPVSWRLFKAETPAGPGLFRDLPPECTAYPKGSRDEVLARAEQALRRRYRDVRREETDRGVVFRGQKGRVTHLGVYAVHLGVLLILAGGVAGALFGFDGYVHLGEGESTAAADLEGGRGRRDLGFTVRCDRFLVEMYENGMPKTFRSDLTFLKDGKTAFQGAVLVNHPLTFGGIRFYQSSYGRSADGRARLSFTAKGKEKTERTVTLGDTFALPGGEGTVQVLRVEENMMQMGPAMKLLVRSNRGAVQIWVFREIERIRRENPGLYEQAPMFNPGLFAPYVFSLDGVEDRYYTVLKAATDPGVPLVTAGGLVLLAGLLIVFLVDHRRVWVLVEDAKGRLRVSVAGRSQRTSAGLERELSDLQEALRGKGEAEE
jgi:cytochrome c biogenesis protein